MFFLFFVLVVEWSGVEWGSGEVCNEKIKRTEETTIEKRQKTRVKSKSKVLSDSIKITMEEKKELAERETIEFKFE